MRQKAGILWLCLSLVAPVWAQRELLRNPSFEEGEAQGVPAGWQRYGGGVPESTLTVELAGREGGKALRLIDTGPNVRDNRYAIGVQQDVPATPGRFYRASCWAKALARNHDQAVVLQITFLGGAEPRSFSTYITPPIGGGWQRFSVGAIAPPETKTVRLYIYTMHFWTSDTLIDDASLREIESGSGIGRAVMIWGYEPLSGPRPLKLQTVLTQAGQPAAWIATPAEETWQALARELQAGLQRKTGALLPLRVVSVQTGPQGEDNRAELSTLLQSQQTIIALGNLNNNFILERLYWNGYTRADTLWPGAGAFALRTVHQPFNFGDINVLTIEASDLAGAQAGVQELLRQLPDGPDCKLAKPLLFVSNVKPMTAEQRQKLLESTPSASLWVDFHRACAAYRDSGDEAWAWQAKRLLGLCRDRLLADPEYKLDWPEETSSSEIGKLWDVIEEAPVWTEAERAEAENVLYATLLGLRRNVYNWGTFADNDTIVWNHQTFPLMGIYWLARWFERYYPELEPLAAYLAQVHGAFRGQIKSWKPQCDADSYLTIVPRHTIEYTLSRNDYTYFANGNVRALAEYLTGVCDNQGNLPGFGDSGYSKGPGYELNALPLAFWYYRDGRYLWRLQQIYEGKWANPYHTDVSPQPWPEIAGVRVFRMPAEYYRWATTYPSYGEPLEKTDVPYELAFDKISFREDMTRDGQFLLLDGFARGKHLHYDGNAIIRYHANGEDWLIDSDYLVRNTTEHNMISVVRDSRCDRLEPAFTRLDFWADLPSCGYTRTTVSDYNGADWTRHIFWLKGELFVVLDELAARQAGDYVFENVFKMLDQGRLEFDGRCLKVTRPTAGGSGSRDLSYTQIEGVGRVVRFGETSSRLEFPVHLPAGEYVVTLWGQGLDASTDSFWLTIDDEEPIACHMPIERLGPSSGAWTKDVPPPNVTIKKSGRHFFRVTLREGPGTLLHKIVIAEKSGRQIATIMAADPPPMPKERIQAAPDACFYIKGDGQAQAALTERINHINLRLKYLRHTFGGRLQAGERVTDPVLFYDERSNQPRDWDLRRVATGTLLLLHKGKRWGYLTTELGGQRQNANGLFYTAGRVVFFGANPKGLPWLRADQPFALEIDLKTGAATAFASQPTELVVDGKPLRIGAGQTKLDLSRWSRLKELASDLARTVSQARLVAPQTARAQPLPFAPLKVAWRMPAAREENGEIAVINCLCPADLNGDGVPELLVGRGKQAVVFDSQGRIVWTLAAEARVNDICVADVNGDNRPEVLIGADDEHLYVTEADGRLRAKIHCTAALRVGTSSVRQPRIAHVAVGDVDADGKQDVIVGTRNGNIVRYAAAAIWGDQPQPESRVIPPVWAFNQIEHGTFRLRLLDLDKDGRLEIVAGNRYGAIEILDCQGRPLPGSYSELGDVVFDVADINGDGVPELLNGSSTGAFTCTPWRKQTAWTFPNYGYGVRDVQCADIDGDGQIETLIASETGYVYALTGDGSVKAQKRLSASVCALVRLRAGILAGCRDGGLYLLDGKLEPQRACRLEGPVTWLAVMPGVQPERVAAAAGESLVMLEL